MHFKICGGRMLGFWILDMEDHQQDEELPPMDLCSAASMSPHHHSCSCFFPQNPFPLLSKLNPFLLPTLLLHFAEEDFINGLFSFWDAWIWVGVWIWVGAFVFCWRFWTLWMPFGLGGSFLLESLQVQFCLVF